MKRLVKHLENLTVAITAAKDAHKKEMEQDNSYCNPGDSAIYDSEFNKKLKKLTEKTAKHISEGLTIAYIVQNISIFKCSDEETTIFKDIAKALKKLEKIQTKFLKNFREGNPYEPQFKKILAGN